MPLFQQTRLFSPAAENDFGVSFSGSILEREKLIEKLTEQVVTAALRENPKLTYERFQEAINTSLEFLMGSLFMREYPQAISIFGSSTAKPESQAYQSVSALASQIVSDSEYYVITGGGPGLMEAGSVGAGKDRCLGAALKLGHEKGPNPHIALERLLKFNSFPPRISTLSKADALVMAEGGVGTAEEGFKIIDLIAKGNISPKAVLWIGKEFYQETFDPLIEFMTANGFVSREIQKQLFQVREDDPKILSRKILESIRELEGPRRKWAEQHTAADLEPVDITNPFPILGNQEFELNPEGKSILIKVKRFISDGIAGLIEGKESKLDKSTLVDFFKDFLDAVYLDAVLDSHLNGDKVTLLLGDTSSADFQRQLENAKAKGMTVLAKSDFRKNQNCIKLWKNRGAGQFCYHIPIRFKYTSLQAFAHHSDQIVVCPGGTGTCAALYQMLTWKQTRQKGGKMSQEPIFFIGEKWFDVSFTKVLESMNKRHYINKSPEDNDFNYGRLINSIDDLL